MLDSAQLDRIEVTWHGPPRYFGSTLLMPERPTLVPFDWVEKFGGTKNLHFDFGPFAEVLRTEVEGRPAFDFWCPLSAVDGYGRHAIDIWRGLRSIGCEVALCNHGSFVDPQHLDPEVYRSRMRAMNLPPSKVGLAMSVPYDPANTDHQSLVHLVITQFETSRIPYKHVERVNLCDHLIVTSSYQLPIWVRCGLKRPISQLTPGVDTDYFSFVERPKDGTFKVLMTFSTSFGRKNPMGAIRIFQQASRGNPDWRFTIKTRRGQGIELVEAEATKDPRIQVITGDAPPDYIRQLYQTHDVFLWPSKGEGVGLPPIEAMSTGMELVCADNSGMSDYCDERFNWPIKTAYEEDAGPPGGFDQQYVDTYGSVGNWWVPDEGHGAKQLERCFEAWYVGKGKGRKAAEMVRSRHTLRHQAESVFKIVQRYL